MSIMVRILTIMSIVVVAVAGWVYWVWCNDPLPPLDPEEWWGPSQLKGAEDVSVRPFKVKFSEEMISDLIRRLANFRAPPPSLEGTASQYGFNSFELDSWRQYWLQKYNFTERQQFFNKFRQYKTKIQGLDIHFVWIRPEIATGVEVVPLLALHGWPGGVIEFYPLFSLLSRRDPNRGFVFEIVAPSLPGYGFSEAGVRPRFGCPQNAVIMRNLMLRLGHSQFYVHAGDWGGQIADSLAMLYPDAVLGLHTNLPVSLHPGSVALSVLGGFFPSWMVAPELVDRMNPFGFWLRETGYFNLHITKPDTIGVALTESPLGLLAFLLEKISIGTNYNYRDRADGGLEEKFSKEALLDIVMLNWMTGSSTTAARLYSHGFSELLSRWRWTIKPITVPTWALQPKYEIIYQTPASLRFKFRNLLNVTVLHKGGHFIALEEPEATAKDVITAVKAFREFHHRHKEEIIDR